MATSAYTAAVSEFPPQARTLSPKPIGQLLERRDAGAVTAPVSHGGLETRAIQAGHDAFSRSVYAEFWLYARIENTLEDVADLTKMIVDCRDGDMERLGLGHGLQQVEKLGPVKAMKRTVHMSRPDWLVRLWLAP